MVQRCFGGLALLPGLLLPGLLLLLGLGGFGLGCANPEYVRGSEVEGLDDPAMSTGLDKRDLQKLMHENMTAFIDSPIVQEWMQ